MIFASFSSASEAIHAVFDTYILELPASPGTAEKHTTSIVPAPIPENKPDASNSASNFVLLLSDAGILKKRHVSSFPNVHKTSSVTGSSAVTVNFTVPELPAPRTEGVTLRFRRRINSNSAFSSISSRNALTSDATAAFTLASVPVSAFLNTVKSETGLHFSNDAISIPTSNCWHIDQ